LARRRQTQLSWVVSAAMQMTNISQSPCVPKLYSLITLNRHKGRDRSRHYPLICTFAFSNVQRVIGHATNVHVCLFEVYSCACACDRAQIKRCNTLQQNETHCNTLQHTANHCTTLQRTEIHCTALRRTATHCTNLYPTATLCNTPKVTSTRCNTLQYPATHCNTLQHTATHKYDLAQMVLHSSDLCVPPNNVRCKHNATHFNTLQHTLQHTAM